MDNYSKILSIMADAKGHITYGKLLREGLKHSSCHIDFYWYTDEQKIDTKILKKIFDYALPVQGIRKRNIDFNRFRSKTVRAIIAKQLAVRKVNELDYSALHFHSYIFASLSIDLMKKLPTVISLDETESLISQYTPPSFRWTHYPNIALGKRVFEAAAQIVTFSEWARKSVIKDYKINEEKVKVVYPGVDLDVLVLPEKPIRDPQKPLNILFVGGDFKRKGGHDVVEVFLQRFSQQVELHMVTKAKIEVQHPNLHIHSNIESYTPEWVKLYHQADVYVMPTHFEPFGWVFIEAMAAGLPVIATRINAIPEIVIHGETGFLIEPGDRNDLAYRIKTFIENPVLCHEMGTKGRKVVEQKFDAQTHCQNLEGIFKQIALSK